MPEKTLKIGLDFDGVIADTTALKIEQAKKIYNVEIPAHLFKEQIVVEQGIMTREQYRALMGVVCGTPEVGLRMAEVPGAVEKIKLFADAGHDLTVITAREGSELEVAQEWCKQRGLTLKFISTGYGKEKTEPARGLDVYLDDGPGHCEQLAAVVPHVFLLTWNYNKDVSVPSAVTRVTSWQEFAQALEHLS
jgi:uncharacterized HAD superfamily protein